MKQEINKIESKFLEALVDWLLDKGYKENSFIKNNEFDMENINISLSEELGLSIYPQYSLGIYVVDFLLEDENKNLRYAVEIDGHEAHKTKEQRYHDYTRERHLMNKEGIDKVIRFTGSEVFVDARRCVKEMISIVRVARDDIQNRDDASFYQGVVHGLICDAEKGLLSKKRKIRYIDSVADHIRELYQYYSPPDWCTIVDDLKRFGITLPLNPYKEGRK